ncbi:hypothetical protein [Mycoplasma sp. 005V]|uniref:hypothetical protein n=1 Tax=unclassified Mycoplasma TaxID=2683645 RepID=UPI003A8B3718
MIPISVIWIMGLLPFLAFIVLVLVQAKFINHVKINRLHLHNNEKMLQKVILNLNLYKYWKMRFVIFSIITATLVLLTIVYTPIAFIFVSQVFQYVDKNQGQIEKITQTGIAVVLWLLDVFFTGLLIWTIYREIYAWNKEMNVWNLQENPEAKSFYEHLVECKSKKEFPNKVKLGKIHFFNRKTTLSYETCNLEKLANGNKKQWYIEGRILFDTFIDYSQILINDRTVEDTDFVAKLLNLLERNDKNFSTKKR